MIVHLHFQPTIFGTFSVVPTYIQMKALGAQRCPVQPIFRKGKKNNMTVTKRIQGLESIVEDCRASTQFRSQRGWLLKYILLLVLFYGRNLIMLLLQVRNIVATSICSSTSFLDAFFLQLVNWDKHQESY
jgi:hypothetical protein